MSWIVQKIELLSTEPLVGNIGKFKVAGRLLEEIVLERAQRVSSSGIIKSNCFLSDLMIEKLKTLPAARIIHDGMILLEFGDNPQTLTDDLGSIFVKYAWDLININEKLVGSLEQSDIRGTVKPGVYIEGNVIIGPGSVLLPGVYIEGNVVIGCDCKIGPNCYIRGNTSIGDKCHIGQAVEVKNSVIMDHSSIGHLGYLGDSVIGNNVNFGGGTVGSNLRHDNLPHKTMINGELISTKRRKFGTIVGDNVHTGIHTTIYPGRKLYKDSTTRPGEIVEHDKQI